MNTLSSCSSSVALDAGRHIALRAPLLAPSQSILRSTQRVRSTTRVSAFAGADPSTLEAGFSALTGLVTTAAFIGLAYATLRETGPQAEQGGYEEREACPRCNGSGYEPCMCTRWSNDNMGCSSCRKTSYMRCRACGGGGKPRLAHVPIKMDVRADNGGYQ